MFVGPSPDCSRRGPPPAPGNDGAPQATSRRSTARYAYTSDAAFVPSPGLTRYPRSRRQVSSADKTSVTFFALRAVAHQADPPGLALERAEAAADLDAPVLEQPLADRQVVDAVGDLDAGQLRQAVAFGRSPGSGPSPQSPPAGPGRSGRAGRSGPPGLPRRPAPGPRGARSSC